MRRGVEGRKRLKIDGGFLRKIAVVIAVVGLLLAYPLAAYASREIILATVAGAVLSTINVLLGYLAIEYSFQKSYSTFLKAVLGGMGVRMLLILGAMVILILQYRMNAVALTVSMFGFTVIYLVLEVLFIQKKVVVRNRE
jgi:hypothetical protein